MELTRVENEWGYIEHDGHEHRVSLALIDKPKTGDWLLAHGDLAVSRIDSHEADTILELIKTNGGHCHLHNHA